MALITGSAVGNVLSQEEIYIEGAPYIYIQDTTATPLFNPDADGYYWSMSGTTAYPVKALGCVQDVSLTENLTMNDIRCDTVGVKSTIQKRNYLELNVTVTSLFPLSIGSDIMNLSTAKVSSGLEKVGVGPINNNKYFMVYMPKVYDDDTGDYLAVHLHRAKFVDAWTINMKSGEPWQATGLKIRAYADDSKPSAQMFGTFIRSDKSALP